LGLPGLLQTLNLNGYNGELIIYGPRGSKKKFQEMVAPYLGFYWDVNRKNKGNFNIVMREVGEGVVFDGGDFFVEAVELDHDCPCLSYSFSVKEKTRLGKGRLAKLGIGNSPLIGELAKGKVVSINGKKVDGKRLLYKEKGRKVVFVMDTRYNSRIVDFVRGADLLISEATYSKEEQDIAEKYGHLSSVDAARIAKKGKVESLVLMHLSQRYDAVPKVILNEAKKIFKNVRVVEDLDVVEL